MKRLKKKAWETIDLYHHTSSQFFMQMMEEGRITSGGYNGNAAGGGHEKVYDVPNKENGNSNLSYPLTLLDDWINNPTGENITKDLVNLVQKKKEENPDDWQNEEIEISVSYPSGNEIGVYLAKNQQDEYDYSRAAINNSKDRTTPNFKATLKIEVQTDALSPDYDDLDYFEVEIDKDSSTPLWKQSLNEIGQCVHNGPIDVGSISGVIFYGLEKYPPNGDKFDNESDFRDFAGKYIQEGTLMATEEAYNQLVLLNQEYESVETPVMASKTIKRLRK